MTIYRKKPPEKDAVINSSRSTTFEIKVPRFCGPGTTFHISFGLNESVEVITCESDDHDAATREKYGAPVADIDATVVPD